MENPEAHALLQRSHDALREEGYRQAIADLHSEYHRLGRAEDGPSTRVTYSEAATFLEFRLSSGPPPSALPKVPPPGDTDG